MQLYKILDGLQAQYNHGNDGMEIAGINHDSRNIQPGEIYVCLNGKNTSGKNYIKEAFDKGARLVVSEEDLGQLPNVRVEDARQAFSLMCKNFYGKACDKLKIIGVTGTNGKTTITNLIADILSSAGKKVGTVGTMGVSYNGKTVDTGFTTPDPNILHKCFHDMLEEGIEYVVMEASAHAIDLKKLAGITFQIGVLTNITQDHLDYFNTMERYTKCKLSFFDKKNMKLGLICSDDEKARSLLNKANIPILCYGLENPSDVFAVKVKSDFQGSNFVCNCMDEIFGVNTNLVGTYNVSNALAAIGVCRALGIDKRIIAKSLRYINPVEGRFNIIKHPKCNIVIDYAHTPDGLENVLKTARQLTNGKLVALFGCGGNRDKSKRRIMGIVASKYADEIILTNDNPRDEDPDEILSQIAVGIQDVPTTIMENRAMAIGIGLGHCGKEDTLVIAGKGGEKYQEIKGKKIPYNDFDAVYKYFQEHLTNLKGQNDDEHNS